MKFIDFWITGFALSTGMAAYPLTPQLPNDTLTLTNNAGIEAARDRDPDRTRDEQTAIKCQS